MTRTRGRRYAPTVGALGALAVLLVTFFMLLAPGKVANDTASPRTGAGNTPGSAGDGGGFVSEPPSGSATPGPAPTGRPSTESFRRADAAMGAMVDARAAWHAPDALTVEEPATLGLTIGDTEDLRRQIELNLPDLSVRDAGVLQVGDNVSAELIADRASLAVQPDRAIDASFGSQPGLLYTWTVRPLQPAAKLRVHVHLTMTVPGTNHVMVRDIPLTLRVDRTLSYTAYQVFSSWTTWAAVVASAAAAFGWVRRRQRERSRERTSAPSPVPDGASLAGHERDRPMDPGGRDVHPDPLVEAQGSGSGVGRQL